MSNLRILNAQIEGARLGFDREVFFTCSLILKYEDGWHQGFGGQVLDDEPAERGGQRQPTAYGMDFIVSLFRTLGVQQWSEIQGMYVRAEVDELAGGLQREVLGIGHIIEDRWFRPAEVAARHGVGAPEVP